MSFSKVGYTVFWVPVRIPPFRHEKISNFNSKPNRVVIQDVGFYTKEGQAEKGYIAISILVNENDIFTIEVVEDVSGATKRNFIELYKLEYIDHDEHGFTQYKLSFNSGLNYDHETVWRSLSTQIYRLFKGLFHAHRYHSDKDFFITNPLPYSKIKITKRSKQSTYYNFYVDQIIEKLKGYRNFLSEEVEGKYSLNFQNKSLLKIRHQKLLSFLATETDKKMGVVAYLNVFKNLEDSFSRLSNYFNDIKFIRDNLLVILNSRRSSASLFLGKVSIAVAFISLGTSIIWTIHGNNTQERFKDIVQDNRRADSLQHKNIADFILASHNYNEIEFDSVCSLIIESNLSCIPHDSLYLLIEGNSICPECKKTIREMLD